MTLVAGLGNPGVKYTNNRHNIGFLVINQIAKNLSLSLNEKSDFKAELSKDTNSVYAKPLTFMNLSGEAIQKIKNFYKVENENIIIVHDDLDLPFGTIKFKIGGSHGGHNGLKSIDQMIGQDYIRVRVGIGKPEHKSMVAHYVLSDFDKDEINKLQDIIIPHVIDAIEAMDKLDITQIKSKYTFKL